jgi:uncharacterized phage protein (TIGR02218 family)
MRNVPDAFVQAVKSGNLKICELFEFTLRCGVVHRYCNHDEDIDWGTPSKRYYSAPILRAPADISMNLEVDVTTLKLLNITAELFDVANTNKLDAVDVVIKRIFWDQSSGSGMEFTLFSGTGNVSFDRNELDLPLSSILNTLNIEVPRNVFQQPCNYTLFDAGCTLLQADYREFTVATSDATDDYSIVAATFAVPPGDPAKYNNGEIHITSGVNLGERRNILLSTDGIFLVSVPFPTKVLAGVTFDYYPGCDYAPETCRDRYGNEPNFYGFVYLPAAEETL